MSLQYFGTDGIRGPYGSERLNEEIACLAGQAACEVARKHYGAVRPRMVIGRDTRASGFSLAQSVARGFVREGGEAIGLGIVPTPAVAYATSRTGAEFGCSVTASHNPSSDNGIKFFQRGGLKPSEELEAALDQAIGQGQAGQAVGGELDENSDCGYKEALQASMKAGLLKGKRLALDCAHGAMCQVAPQTFEALGAQVTAIGVEPDGDNINQNVGSEHCEALQSLMKRGDFHAGMAFDGDGDRLVLFDENGDRLPGEAVMLQLAMSAKRRGILSPATLVTTVQSNLGLDAALLAEGIEVLRVDVGDKHVSRRMIAEGHVLGGEESGHLVLREFSLTGDGLFAALAVLREMTETGEPLNAWRARYQPFPQLTRAIQVSGKPPLEQCHKLRAAISRATRELGQQGRLLVRYSGTEPKLRLLVEARSETQAAQAMDRLVEAALAELQATRS